MKSCDKKALVGVCGVILGVSSIWNSYSTAAFWQPTIGQVLSVIIMCAMVFSGLYLFCKSITLVGDSVSAVKADDGSWLWRVNRFLLIICEFFYELSVPLIRKLDQFHDWMNRDDSKK